MSLWIVSGILLFAGVLITGRGIGRFLLRGRLVAGSARAAGGMATLFMGALSGLIGLNLQTYQALTLERPVAEIRVERAAPQRYRVTLIEPETGTQRRFDLAGDEWQMDARVLRFHPWANILGFDAVYRLDRISGRYAAAEQDRTGPRTVHALTAEPGLNMAEVAGHPVIRAAKVIDTEYGNSAFMPLADGAVYQVTITQDSLLPRPANAAARQALEAW